MMITNTYIPLEVILSALKIGYHRGGKGEDRTSVCSSMTAVNRPWLFQTMICSGG